MSRLAGKYTDGDYANGDVSRVLPSSEQRDAKKQTQTGNEGLLDAIAVVTGDDKHAVRAFLGEDRSFHRATEYVSSIHPELALDDVSDIMLSSSGGAVVALLNCDSGKFVLQQIYTVDGEKRYHCAALDMGLEWGARRKLRPAAW